jgi:cob(I)alamin adenosyltransferase
MLHMKVMGFDVRRSHGLQVRKGRRSSLRHLLRLLCAFVAPRVGAEDADILASVPRIYTRQGDDGTTGLLYGGRVSKADRVTEACGTVDEAVAILGLARAHASDPADSDELLGLQRELFVVGADLATNPGERGKLEPGVSLVTEEMTERLEARIDKLVAAHPLPNAFVVPGANPASASLDVARGVVRRAERRAVEIRDSGAEVNDAVLRYLNRLSDLLFILAREAAGETEPASR